MYYIQTKLVNVELDTRSRITHEDNVPYEETAYRVTSPSSNVYWESTDKVDNGKEYIKVSDNNSNKLAVSEIMVMEFIKDIKVYDLGEKTTCVVATLANGYEITETSACVSKDNYNREIGKEICLKAIKDKVYELLGFLLQTAIWSSQKEDN